ncbi:hypothetical protein J8TS2_35670 [Lederbergia ruris]|uniref:Peptidase S74 domain-containing protein n=1 Tax=Lederbergia ruris TaxID=217495 RepID=A0ABQ4KP96_9BACI|nr:phage tail protein [Lederbergia ruris]GIN59248.1 hypothetical protein J8TS2_35670 [Lederbergia ruris]
MSEIYILNKNGVSVKTFTEETGLISTKFEEGLNKGSSFLFELDATVHGAEHVKEENKVIFKDKEGDLRLFVIKEIDDINTIDGAVTEATCEPESMELKDKIIVDRRFSNQTAQAALNAALQGTRWTGVVEVELGNATTNFYYITAIDAIWKIMEVWGGEFKDVVEFDGNKITARKIIIKQRLGADNGARFEIDHNIEEIQRTVLSYPITAMYGRGASLEIEDDEGNATGGHTRYIDFGDVEWSVAKGDPVDKPKGPKWVGDPDALLEYGYEHNGQLLHREAEFSNQDYEDPKELLQATWEALQQAKKPEVNYRLTVDVSDQNIALGDTARVIDREFSRPIEIQTRIISIEYDILDIDGSVTVEMGQFLSAYEDDRLDQVIDTIDRNQGKWGADSKPITNDRFPDIKPGTPINVEAIGAFETIQLHWDYDSEIYISHYEVYGSKVKDFVPDSQHLLWRGRVSSFSHEVKADETWYYRLRAVNTRGTASDYSNQVTASSRRIITDDILFGSIVADHLENNLDIADKLAQNTIDRINQGPMQEITYTQQEIEATEERLNKDLNNRIGNVNQAIDNLNNVADNLRDRADSTDSLLSEHNGRINTIVTDFDELEGRFSTTLTDIQKIDNTVQSHSAKLLAQADLIAAKVDDLTYQRDKSGILSSIEANTTELSLVAEGLSARVTKEEFDSEINGVKDRVSTTEATLTVQAGLIEAKAKKNEVYTRTQTDELLGDKVDTTVYNNKVGELITSIDNVTARVSNTETSIDTLTGNMTSALSQIANLDVRANQIDLRVSEVRADLDDIEIYRVVATKYNSSYRPYSGIYRKDGSALWGNNNSSNRSYWLSIYDRASKKWDSHTRYDLYNDSSKAKDLADALNSLDNNKLIVLVGSHAPANNRLLYGLPQAIYRCGGSKDVFENTDWTGSFPSYILIGIPGMGEGVGTEHFSPADVGWLDIQLIINNGNVQFSGYHENVLSRVSSAEASITTLAGQIELKANQISVLDNRMTAAESRINVLPNEIDLAVTQGIDGLEIGGRNFVKNSGELEEIDRNYKGYDLYLNSIADLVDKYIAISFDARSLDGNSDVVRVYFRGGNSTYYIQNVPLTTAWNRYEIILKVSSTIANTESTQIAFHTNSVTGSPPGTVFTGEFKNVKLEKGNKATDWSPAPEDQVNKTNVLSSINLSKEGVRIAGDKIHLSGQSLIDDAIIGTAAIANLSVTNQKIANLAVGTGQIQNLAVTNAKIANLAVDDAKIANVSVNKLKAGEIDTSKIKIRGGSAIDYMLIDGSYLESRGKYTRTWKGQTTTRDIKIKFENGYMRARNDSLDQSLYYSDFGISTYADGVGDGVASGTLEFFSYQYGNARGVTLQSFNGAVALNADNNKIILDAKNSIDLISVESPINIKPQSEKPGYNTFQFVVANGESSAETHGYLMYGSDVNGWGAGLRFSKKVSDPYIDVVDSNFNTGGNTRLEAGELRANEIYKRDRSYGVYWNKSGGGTLNNGNALEAGGIRTIEEANNFYIGTRRDGEVRVTDGNGFNNGGTINYRDIRVRNLYLDDQYIYSSGGGATLRVGRDGSGAVIQSMTFYNRTYSGAPNLVVTDSGTIGRSTSALKYKEYVEEVETKGYSDKILNLKPKSWYDKAEIRENGGSTVGLKRYYGLIAEDVIEVGMPEYVTFVNGEAEGLEYDRLWTQLIPVTKGIKDDVTVLKDDVFSLQTEVDWLKLENQYLRQKIKQLEEKIV